MLTSNNLEQKRKIPTYPEMAISSHLIDMLILCQLKYILEATLMRSQTRYGPAQMYYGLKRVYIQESCSINPYLVSAIYIKDLFSTNKIE